MFYSIYYVVIVELSFNYNYIQNSEMKASKIWENLEESLSVLIVVIKSWGYKYRVIITTYLYRTKCKKNRNLKKRFKLHKIFSELFYVSNSNFCFFIASSSYFFVKNIHIFTDASSRKVRWNNPAKIETSVILYILYISFVIESK